ncbi:MAG: UDP-N-acetylglucosamine--N-acetylmuramyl-(pentapeptide) pyrophosphoryl-undecaprenol N-acetylglucosamine transferase [Phycisphaerae bacterium]|nr:UDP-N-acetylglucosamine--N-acetylmuramyl-(pentapeptide) pyrophosphoryl-undecaprenol N-acetylglucosamine transferase [Phycisphaerae bacterium]
MGADKPWFVIAGGGTGGHLYPGLAVAEALRALQPDFDVTVFGTPRAVDKRLTDTRGYELVSQHVRPLSGKPWHWPRFLMAWRRSVKAARERFEARRPAVVLGLGGYAAAPAVVAAAKLGVPTAIFNPDAMPGRANKRLAPQVDRVFVQWEETAERFPGAKEVLCTGCPIRGVFSRANAAKGYASIKLDPDKRTLLITGASQGARSINATAMQLFDLWRVATEWQILHLTGPADLEECRAMYKKHGIAARALAFTEHMAYCMAVADLVVSRAGASTLAEITAMGLPSVLMPYPFDRRRHQLANADVLVRNHAAALVEDKDDPVDNARRLREELRDIMRSEERRRHMARCAGTLGRTGAAEEIARELFEMASKR